jgi:hypothetical protein
LVHALHVRQATSAIAMARDQSLIRRTNAQLDISAELEPQLPQARLILQPLLHLLLLLESVQGSIIVLLKAVKASHVFQELIAIAFKFQQLAVQQVLSQQAHIATL